MGLFNRKYSDDGDTKSSDNSFFSHSESFHAVVSDKHRHKKEQAERAKLKRERKEDKDTEHKSKVNSEHVKEEGVAKRRRITPGEASKLLRQAGFSMDQPVTLEDDNADRHEPMSKVTSKVTIRKSPRLNRTVNIEDSGPAPDTSPSRQRGRATLEPPQTTSVDVVEVPDEEYEDEDSDPEIARLRKRARERRKQKELEASLALNSPDGDADTTLGAAEAKVQYLITSPIEGTTPLMVHRKLSQPLKPLREAWLQRQTLPPHIKEQIFFAHCRRKVYDASTGKALGLRADAEGRVTMVGMESKEGADHVILEAVTEEHLKSMQEAQAAEDRKRFNGPFEADGEVQGEPAVVTSKQPEEPRFKTHLRAKGRPDLRTSVKASTPVATIEWFARREWEISPDANLWLEFDGERLEHGVLVRDTEIMTCEDEVTIDVYIR